MSTIQDTERKIDQPLPDGALPPAFQPGIGIINAVLAFFTIAAGTVMMGYFATAHPVARARDYLERYPVSTIEQTTLSEMLTGSIGESLATLLLVPSVGLALLVGLMYSRRLWPAFLSAGFIALGIAVAIMGEQVIR